MVLEGLKTIIFPQIFNVVLEGLKTIIFPQIFNVVLEGFPPNN